MIHVTYRQWITELSLFAERNDNNPIDRLAYKLCEGEFRGIAFDTPVELMRELSRIIQLSEQLEQAIIKSALAYVDFIHEAPKQ